MTGDFWTVSGRFPANFRGSDPAGAVWKHGIPALVDLGGLATHGVGGSALADTRWGSNAGIEARLDPYPDGMAASIGSTPTMATARFML